MTVGLFILLSCIIGLVGCIMLLVYACCKVAGMCDQAEEREEINRRLHKRAEREVMNDETTGRNELSGDTSGGNPCDL